MRSFMEAIFTEASGRQVKFPETSMSKAYGISGKTYVTITVGGADYRVNLGRQKFDGYSKVLEINGKTYKIAFEYDGSYHDDKDHFYYTRFGKDFNKVKANDLAKSLKANDEDTIIIRLKAVEGFDIHSVDQFQQEIVRQFEELTGQSLSIKYKYVYDFHTNKLIKTKAVSKKDIQLKDVDNFIGKR